VPDVEPADVVSMQRGDSGFQLSLSSGETVEAARVVVAVGTAYFANLPGVVANLPPEFVSHSSQPHELERFRGRDVTVVGAGQSALETAALLHEAGASVRVLVRKPHVEWNGVPTPNERRTLRRRLLRPAAGLCDGWRCWFLSYAPGMFYYLPTARRLRIVRTWLGPAGAWWLRSRVEGRVPILVGRSIRAAEPADRRLRLEVTCASGAAEPLMTDHLIMATGIVSI
jgi:cation diffusion facilitator CzcD-associated flavoprotein CzcO